MKIYTKTGDRGQTSLVDGSKLSKSHLRLESYGTVDELNSHMGMLISMLENVAELKPELLLMQKVQVWLFQMGSQLACSDPKLAKKLPNITEQEIKDLEVQMDQWDQELPPLKNFILPGGHQASSQAHICRTVCRRCERICVRLEEQEALSFPAVPFLNRLSDYFYVLARLINHRLKIASIEWKP